MKPEKINELLAVREGYTIIGHGRMMLKNPNEIPIPATNYLDPDDHNPIQRIVDGLSDEEGDRYFIELMEMSERGELYRVLNATVAQKVEAVLRALELWEE